MNTKVLSIAAVAIICLSAVGVYYVTLDDDDGPISIVDGSGKTITLDAPIDKAIVVNTNIAKALNILGLNDNVAGLSFSAASSGDRSWESMKDLFPEAKRTSSYKELTAEEARQLGKYVICPVSSMTITDQDQITAFEEMGITLIRLDCNGEDVLDDFEKLVKLFGGSDEIKEAYNAYISLYTSTVEAVIAKAKEAGTIGNDETFLFLMGNGMGSSKGGAFYLQESELSKTTEAIFGTNAIRNTDLTSTGVTVTADNTNTPEVLTEENGKKQISKLLVRSTTKNDPSTIWGSDECIIPVSEKYENFVSGLGPDTVYTIHTDLLSGPISYIGYILIAEACGIDTGLNVTELVEDFNDKYGFDEVSTDYLYKIVYDGDTWNAVSIVVE